MAGEYERIHGIFMENEMLKTQLKLLEARIAALEARPYYHYWYPYSYPRPWYPYITWGSTTNNATATFWPSEEQNKIFLNNMKGYYASTTFPGRTEQKAGLHSGNAGFNANPTRVPDDVPGSQGSSTEKG